MSVQTETRNAGLVDLRNLLVEQHARKIDMVAPASKIKAVDGNLVVAGTNPILTDDGVTVADGTYRPTEVADEGIASKLEVPLGYVRRMRAERPDLWDANVNAWLHGRKPKGRYLGGLPPQGTWEETRPGVAGDPRSFLIRGFRGDDGEDGIARAFLSDRYAVMDNLDALTAALDGVAQAGVEVEIEGCDLTDRRMYVRIKAPGVAAYAPHLLKGYRSPFSGLSGADNPVISAGLVISNSETGGGAFQIVPRLVVEVCSNGMTMTKDAMRQVHLGGRMSEGVIRWSADTEKKNLDLITAKARDSVATFLDHDYVVRQIVMMEKASGAPLKDAQDQVALVTKRLGYDKETADSVFSMFVKGGDLTAGGVMHAVTAAAREVTNADLAHEMESHAFRALEIAASL